MNNSQFGILIVDDEPNICSGLKKGLSKLANVVQTANTGDEAIELFKEGEFQLVFVDMRLPGTFNGLELLERILLDQPHTTVIMISAHGTMELAVEAMKLGAFDFISKPLDLNLIRQQVLRAKERSSLQDENNVLRHKLANIPEYPPIIGTSEAVRGVMTQVQQIASTDATVMILGESGTGKELVARALHEYSDRREGPFTAVNLGALPESLLESELFGHEQGAFTGAIRRKPGCFEQAGGGTLLLDEITEIPPKSQVDLLRVLETGNFTRVGGEELLECNVRVVSATNKDVQKEIDRGNFREDLFYRLNIVPIRIPPLRERREDIPLLAEHFLRHFCIRHHGGQKRISPDAMELLVEAHWPGNVRQLRNVIERLVITVNTNRIQKCDIPTEATSALRYSKSTHPKKTMNDFVVAAEIEAIRTALDKCGNHRDQTAKHLGISVRTLQYKISRYNLQ